MINYTAPVRDMRFLFNELLDGPQIQKIKCYEDFTPEVIDAMLEEGAKFTKEVLLPLNLSGDKEGCILENGVVRTPNGFKDAYDKFVEAGWTSLASSPEYGGQGAPAALYFLLQEMICSTNMAFSTYPGLTEGAYNAIKLHGSENQKNLYLPNFTNGNWSGTMCLTEPQCGTDLGLIKTKAEPTQNDSYKISGTKIFITAGEHDLTENIVHLVLGRLPDAPKGIKGISLFLVPKFIPTKNGRPGERNSLACGSIESKMGIKGSATCVMNFDNAIGWIVGKPNNGMKAMFTMMNSARLGVGIQGIGLAEVSYQNALAYAQDRLQGRALSGSKSPDKVADSILVHPDVRKNLLTVKSLTEGMRAISLWTALNLDIAEKSDNLEEKKNADNLVQLMTPIVKAFCTDKGFNATNTSLQIFGGHGYIHEYGMEQFVRDARITQIYEGTNGVQALDLVGRKMPTDYGRYLRSFFHPVEEFIQKNSANKELEFYILGLAKAFGRLQQATAIIAQKGLSNRDELGSTASEYLSLFGYVAIAYMWAKTSKVCIEMLESDETGFYTAKLKTAKFYYDKILPETGSLFSIIMSGGESIMSFSEDEFEFYSSA